MHHSEQKCAHFFFEWGIVEYMAGALQDLTLLMLEIPAMGISTMPADALAPKVARASAGMVLAVWNRWRVLLFQSQFHWLQSIQIHDTFQNVNITFLIFKSIQHVKS